MIFKVRLMRRGGRRLSWLEITNSQSYTGELTTIEDQSKEGHYQYAELTAVSGLSKRLLPPLYEPVLTGIAPLALVLRGFERMKEPEGYYSVVQEWYCEVASNASRLFHLRT